MTTLEVLEAAYKLIRPKSRWAQGRLAEDEDGNSVMPRSPAAQRWCAAGACEYVGGDGSLQSYRAIDTLDELSPVRTLADLNDKDGHAAVLALFRKAIASEKRKAAKG